MFKKFANKRGVSPVIAVVLLIALTVAAVAVLWNMIPPVGEMLVTITTIDADGGNGIWKGNLYVSDDCSIVSFEIQLDNGTLFNIGNVNINTLMLNPGDNTIIVEFGGSISLETTDISFGVQPNAGDSKSISYAEVTFA